MIEVNNLYFSYDSSKNSTVKNLNFHIKKGEILGFLGPSGAGKSTTQKILYGLFKDYSGSAKIMDKEIKLWGSNLYEKIGICFELPNLYSKLTALENLNFMRDFYSVPTIDAMDLLKMVDLEDKANLKVSQYSKGMKMRLNFARAFVNNPEIIFLDEPTSGLDPVNARNIKDIILRKKSENKTIFLTTHNMNTADELCDRVAFIVDGEIKLIDSPKNLKLKYRKNLVKVEYFNNNILTSCEFELDSLGYNEAFLDTIKRYSVKTIHSQEATLEDIFIKVTGRKLQ